ncbi:phage tail protein [Prosthecomicrobium pneumaticum]|uniref:Microcystin-dependent protein n=1 Tax=Prosthecomicrobium pneumaticum TaxID=81895 RepID=A0A7W9FLI3_9HYPH|nr:tail fiber protein [Prosthecomicrobium pneumaticum]MBB5752868.1 microcystin-dependent protein [Prosthecomicrobium pneumaticum]
MEPVPGPLLGQVSLFAGNFVPRGWMSCDGSLLAIKDNMALFAIIGTLYGGNGTTTFAVPDLRSVAPMHDMAYVGQRTASAMTGAPAVVLATNQLPSHTHKGSFTGTASNATVSMALTVKDTVGNADPQAGDFLGKGGTGGAAAPIYVRKTSTAADVRLSPTMVGMTMVPQGTVTVGLAGSGEAVVLPHIKMIWAICIVGLMPSRW